VNIFVHFTGILNPWCQNNNAVTGWSSETQYDTPWIWYGRCKRWSWIYKLQFAKIYVANI